MRLEFRRLLTHLPGSRRGWSKRGSLPPHPQRASRTHGRNPPALRTGAAYRPPYDEREPNRSSAFAGRYGFIPLAGDNAEMYERFTDRARKVMQLANQEAQRFNHEYIGTEHILLGLVKEGSGVAANVLKNLDVDLRKIRLEVEKI